MYERAIETPQSASAQAGLAARADGQTLIVETMRLVKIYQDKKNRVPVKALDEVDFESGIARAGLCQSIRGRHSGDPSTHHDDPVYRPTHANRGFSPVALPDLRCPPSCGVRHSASGCVRA